MSPGVYWVEYSTDIKYTMGINPLNLALFFLDTPCVQSPRVPGGVCYKGYRKPSNFAVYYLRWQQTAKPLHFRIIKALYSSCVTNMDSYLPIPVVQKPESKSYIHIPFTRKTWSSICRYGTINSNMSH